MHFSVMKSECIENLKIKSNGIYVDGTIGLAGHSSEILKKLDNGFLYGFDQDEFAINQSTKKLSLISNNFKLFHENFKDLKKCLNEINVEKVDGILLDLGLSSPQIDDASRGFSFMKDAKLDMRMDKRQKKTAYVIVNEYSLEDLTNIFYTFGEERYSKSIAKKIVETRKEKNIESTLELVNIIKKSVPTKYFIKSHPERQIFQAIRIEVNSELNVLNSILPDAIDMLNKGGRLCVITFHSLEDKIVKQIFKKYSDIDEMVKGLPVIPEEFKPSIKLINNKPILPSREELEINSRSKSAKLRVIERL